MSMLLGTPGANPVYWFTCSKRPCCADKVREWPIVACHSSFQVSPQALFCSIARSGTNWLADRFS